MEDFYQLGPRLDNQFSSDSLLKWYLKVNIPDEFKEEIFSDLERFGERVVTDVWQMACDAEAHPPEHIPFDAWGKRIDEIKVSEGWRQLDRVSAEEGLVALGYERKFNEYSRIYQYAKMYLFHPASAYYGCPLAMTDGAAKLIELFGDQDQQQAYQHLTSKNPEKFWTSGQWMTEKAGGSDVGRSQTIAKYEDHEWRLYGTKWFTSATTSQMTMTLARIEDQKGQMVSGSRGLSLFYLELRDDKDKLNGIEILRLKDKLGTKALPTAELKLIGAKAKLVGKVGEGVKSIASLFNITRIQNSFAALGTARRVLNLAKDYAGKRQAFGRFLKDHPLHIKNLAEYELKFHSMFHLSFFTAKLLGLSECTEEHRQENEKLLRLLTPVSKLYTAKLNMSIVSEVIESFGGAGYCEDTGLPRWLRDAQTLTIWEGTTNILSLDLLRAIEKDQAFPIWVKKISAILRPLNSEGAASVKTLLQDFVNEVEKVAQKSPDDQQAIAREFAFQVAEITSAALMLEFSVQVKDAKIFDLAAQRWSETLVLRKLSSDEKKRKDDFDLLFG